MRNLFILLALGLVISCGAPSSVKTPEGQAAFKADQVVLALGNLQDLAITLNHNGKLSTDATKVIVLAVVESVKVIKTNPTNVRMLVGTALKQIESDLSATDLQKIQSLLNIVKALLV